MTRLANMTSLRPSMERLSLLFLPVGTRLLNNYSGGYLTIAGSGQAQRWDVAVECQVDACTRRSPPHSESLSIIQLRILRKRETLEKKKIKKN